MCVIKCVNYVLGQCCCVHNRQLINFGCIYTHTQHSHTHHSHTHVFKYRACKLHTHSTHTYKSLNIVRPKYTHTHIHTTRSNGKCVLNHTRGTHRNNNSFIHTHTHTHTIAHSCTAHTDMNTCTHMKHTDRAPSIR